MKYFLARGAGGLVRFLMLMSISCLALRAGAQTNIWTNPASGNWQDASWSLGILPGTNQTVLLTNSGWKALQIGAGTAQNFPQSLDVDSIVISSPTNSFNTLLLNYAGFTTPLTVKTLSVASNSAVTMYSSALQINGPNGVGMTIGGQFDQNDSVVGGNQVNVGYIGAGIYNLNSGLLAVSNLWVGGPFEGVFNQSGGTNAFGITDIDGGDYVLTNGYFGAAIYFDDDGQFYQQDGVLNSDLTIFGGSYVLAGGIHQGNATVPSTDGWSSGAAGMLQTGGTNLGSLDIGSYGYGSYTMSNGVSLAGNVSVDYGGTYTQWGGTQEVATTIDITEQEIAQETYAVGFFNLNGGQVSSAGMLLGGYYTQTGASNLIAGDVTMQGTHSSLSLSGGLLTAENITANPGYVGGIFLSGGTLVVSNELWIGGNGSLPDWRGFVGGGELIVSNIWLAPQASFSCGVGTIIQSGTLTLANASLYAGTNEVQFGALQLADDGNTNSTLYMPSGASTVGFADSSVVTWSNETLLTIENWSGSLYGGGQQQIIFGTNSAALTATQLGQIQFQNPAGLAAGSYPARILSNGEIVPSTGGALPASMALSSQAEGMRVTLQGEAGRTYCIEVSTDLVHWVAWTNVVNAKGTMCCIDSQTTNCPARFYRAKLLP
jgi:hypothetical protein